MKKVMVLIQFLVLSIALMAQRDITVSLIDSEAKEFNLLGLSLLEVQIENTNDSSLQIHAPSHIFFEAKLPSDSRKIIFYEGNAKFASGKESILLTSGEILRYKINLNLFEFAREYNELFGEIPNSIMNIPVRIGIYCNTHKKSYYSNEFSIIINPLSDIDQSAFEYLSKNSYDPFQFVRKGEITVFSIDKIIIDSVMTKYPESTFAELASLSLAYQNAKETKARPELKSKVTQLLEKPLASQYSFVRYLAEELKKSLY